jgi:ATP-dependent exoDNAse (exonuclease V) alpha subunit
MVNKLPFVLEFVITVHRCQGMTLDAMTFNLGPGCFAPGQLYVALSRVKRIQYLVLHVPICKSDVITSNAVLNYYTFFSGKCSKVTEPYIPS